MTSLTAIDMLILPDDTMLNHAKAWNARLLQSYPDGFELDSQHTPHITLLQRYVATEQLDDVYKAVGDVVTSVPVTTLELTGVSWPTWSSQPSPELVWPELSAERAQR